MAATSLFLELEERQDLILKQKKKQFQIQSL